MKNHMKNLTCLTTWLVVAAPLICGLGCGASTQTSHYEYLPTNHQDTQAGDAYKNSGRKFFKYEVSFTLANNQNMDISIKIEKCINGSTCEPIKNKAIYTRSDKSCEVAEFVFFGISDETGTAIGTVNMLESELYDEKNPPKRVIYVSNKIESSKFKEKNYLRKGDTCPGKKEKITYLNPSMQLIVDDNEKKEIEHKKFISDLIEIETISFGTDFFKRKEYVWKENMKSEIEWKQSIINASAKKLIAECKASPDDEKCEEMMKFVSEHVKNMQIKDAAEQVYIESQSEIGDTLWRNTYSNCAAPTHSNSCEGVKKYISRFKNGKHIEEAQKLIQKATPALERFAIIEAAAKREEENRINEAKLKVFLTCVGTCMGNGVDRQSCVRRCEF
jgi:hypothetical protein